MTPFYYFNNLKFDSKNILLYIDTLSDENWLDSGIMRYGQQNLQDEGKMWTANNINITSKMYDKYKSNLQDTNKVFTDFSQCAELDKIIKYFHMTDLPLFDGMVLKKTIKDHPVPNPTMQNFKKNTDAGIRQTYDIVIPIQGDFKTGPLIATNKRTNEEFSTQDNGYAFIAENTQDWSYKWQESTYPYRYTFHLRGYSPLTFKLIRKHYDRNGNS